MIVYQEEIAPPGPLPDPDSETADVLLSRHPTESLEQIAHG